MKKSNKLKSAFYLLLLLLFNQLSYGQVSSLDNNPKNFDWLLGHWQRTNETEGKETFETWVKLSNNEYHGIGFTLQNNDTIFLENILLIESNQSWNLEVSLKDDINPTIFHVVNIEKENFECTNEFNEFPKKIRYWKDGDKIKATVSGDDMEISFEFMKIEK